ncbi:MAG: nidogen-like domain-containing protein [Bacteroidota bacterium]
MKKFLIFLGCLWLILPCRAQVLCKTEDSQSIYVEDFESNVADSWTLLPASDGGQWTVGTGNIGMYPNPGSGSWIYVSDEKDDNIGEAILESPDFDLAGMTDIRLTVDILFQEYGGKGKYQLKVWDGREWLLLHEGRDDIVAHLEIDLSAFALNGIKIQFVYNDEGSWGWGMGLDNLSITATQNTCGNGICERGEVPTSCEDCQPIFTEWIAPGKDLRGKDVSYLTFQRNSKCDDCSEWIPLDFDINCYGKSFQSLYLNANGNITFGGPLSDFNPEPFCLEGPYMIAPFFADVDISLGGNIYTYADPEGHYWLATWKDVAYYGSNDPGLPGNTFSVLLTDGSIHQLGETILPLGTNVVFLYDEMNWTTGRSSGGIDGFGGAAATVGMNFGDGLLCNGYGRFDRGGYGYSPAHQANECAANGVSHLNQRVVFFNSESGEVLDGQGQIMVEAVKDGDKVRLRFQTDLVSTAESFSIQRLDPEQKSFVALFDLYPSEHLPTDPTAFEAWDATPMPDTNIYRILINQANGIQKTSEERAVIFQPGTYPSGRFQLTSVGPNPLQSDLKIGYEKLDQRPINYILTDMSGRMIFQGKLDGGPGQYQQSFSVRNLIAGQYIFSMMQGEERQYRQLIKL